MDINWQRYKQIIINDRTQGYKPDKQLFRRLRRLFPKISIWGFGKYYDNYWFILADCPDFPENPLLLPGVRQGSVPLTEVVTWAVPILFPLTTA